MLDMKPLPVKLPEELHAEAKAKSKRTGIPIAFIVRRAIEKWVREDQAEEEGAEEKAPKSKRGGRR